MAWFIFSFFYGEKIQVHNGLGWDGARYAYWATMNPLYFIRHGEGVDLYLIQRIFPSSVIFFATHLLKYPLSSPARMVNAFYIYDFIMLSLSGLALWQIAKHLKWDLKIFYLAMAGIFFNFPILKHFPYHPNLTDLTAFSLGIFLIYFYLKNNLFGLIIVTVAAAFTYPSMLYGSFCLLLFKMNHNFQEPTHLQSGNSKINNVITLLCAAILVIAIYYIYKFDAITMAYASLLRDIHRAPILLSTVAFFLFIYFSLKPLIDYRYAISSIKKVTWQGIILCIALLVFFKEIVPLLSNGHPGALTITQFFKYILIFSIVNPFNNLVSHILFFGPGVLLVVFFWKDIANLAKEISPGMVLFLILYVLLAIGPESRQIINAWPVFFILACQVLHKKNLSWKQCYIFIVLCLLASRFYIHLNGNWTGAYMVFPDQKYFMNFGPWLSDDMYLVFAGISALLALILYFVFKESKTSTKQIAINNAINDETFVN
jgi:hypothetical protein